MGAAARMRLLMSAPGPVRMEMAELIASSARGSDAAEIARDFGDELLRICANTDNARFARVLTVQLDVGRADAPPLADEECALSIAAFRGHVAVLRVLLDTGYESFSARSLDRDGRTALHAACAGGQVEVVDILLARGARVNKADRRGHVPAAAAIASGCEGGGDACLRRLLESGQDVNVRTNTRETLASLAIRFARPVALTLLLSRRPQDVTEKFWLSRRLIDVARKKDILIPSILANFGADLEIPTVLRQEFVCPWTYRGAARDPDFLDVTIESALSAAVRSQNVRLLRFSTTSVRQSTSTSFTAQAATRTTMAAIS
jgi:hypothetical protein